VVPTAPRRSRTARALGGAPSGTRSAAFRIQPSRVPGRPTGRCQARAEPEPAISPRIPRSVTGTGVDGVISLDRSATTPIAPAVYRATVPVITRDFGHSSSDYPRRPPSARGRRIGTRAVRVLHRRQGRRDHRHVVDPASCRPDPGTSSSHTVGRSPTRPSRATPHSPPTRCLSRRSSRLDLRVRSNGSSRGRRTHRWCSDGPIEEPNDRTAAMRIPSLQRRGSGRVGQVVASWPTGGQVRTDLAD